MPDEIDQQLDETNQQLALGSETLTRAMGRVIIDAWIPRLNATANDDLKALAGELTQLRDILDGPGAIDMDVYNALAEQIRTRVLAHAEAMPNEGGGGTGGGAGNKPRKVNKMSRLAWLIHWM